MKRDEVIAVPRAHEPELKAAGVASLSLFGSVARGDDRDASDVAVVVRLTEEASPQGGFA
jgi:predicted nucleotidyltransferase